MAIAKTTSSSRLLVDSHVIRAFFIAAWIKHIACRRLDLLIEVEYFDVGILLAIALSALVPLVFLLRLLVAVLVAE